MITPSTNGEKMTLNINIKIDNSEALQALAYNSDTEILFVTFKSGSTYDYKYVSVNAMLDLIARAINRNSWGKAHAEWKKVWKESATTAYTQELVNVTADFVDGLSPIDRKHLSTILPIVLAAQS